MGESISYTSFLVLAIIATVPAFLGGYFKVTYDGGVHLTRWESIYQALKHGKLPVLVNFIGFQGIANAYTGLYPWITSLLFILPRFIFTTNPIAALFCGFVLLNFMTPYAHRLNAKGYLNSLSLNQAVAESVQYEDYVPYAANVVRKKVFYHQIIVNKYKYYLSASSMESGYQAMKYKVGNLKNKNSSIVLPFFIYNAKDYTAYVNGKRTTLFVSKHSLAQVHVKNKRSAVIKIRYNTPMLYIVARVISILTILLLIVGLIYLKLKRMKKSGQIK
ncbi:hypothetical protein [Liquorilactobacillus hordei]|uniref:Uncharacterized protein n=1 Tax=Liquorilactobacillus hordei DSM 19519 TaxID=1423759 RepID=A0A0R1MD85_9LACO|nr:hypothetical protein [Liquorilactobacillus hordei]KRL06135.1 hypothetical protein FC92_GL001143 [Liquorilactobacillus hordei DSM 19519]QYH53037.1 hypothetical protein G6O70_11890 [Liquorilactobacillus hordei DSM 19519]